MKQPVIVAGIDGPDVVRVKYPDPKGDKSKTSRSFWGVREKDFPVSNDDHLSVREGDMVEIFIDPSGAVKAAFMIFIFPLLCFLLAYYLISFLSGNEVLLYLGGTAGLAGGFMVNKMIRKVRGPGDMPRLLRVMTHDDIEQFKSCNSACKTCKGCG